MSERIDRLPWRTKFGYGSAELGLVAIEVHLEIYLLKFYNVVIGLPAQYAGIAVGIAILWDAVCDVVMGWISDRTRSPRRFGPDDRRFASVRRPMRRSARSRRDSSRR